MASIHCNRATVIKRLTIICVFLALLKLALIVTPRSEELLPTHSPEHIKLLLQYDTFRHRSVRKNNSRTSDALGLYPVNDVPNDIPADGQNLVNLDYLGGNRNAQTELGDVFIGVKTTKKYHQTRLSLLLDTWIQVGRKNTWVFTDSNDTALAAQLAEGHWVDTSCPGSHQRRDLVCKVSAIFDLFAQLRRYRWLCIVDDDTYVNVPNLISLLAKHNHRSNVYLGKPSLRHPLRLEKPGSKTLEFWFATGGAGYCISHALVLQMLPFTTGGRMMTYSDQIHLPDDVTVGYIISSLIKVELTRIAEFHSHLEGLWQIDPNSLDKQITLSYGQFSSGEQRIIHNVVNTGKVMPIFPAPQDPTRLKSIHCYLFPSTINCPSSFNIQNHYR